VHASQGSPEFPGGLHSTFAAGPSTAFSTTNRARSMSAQCGDDLIVLVFFSRAFLSNRATSSILPIADLDIDDRAKSHFIFSNVVLLFTMKTLLLIGVLVVLAQAQIPPRVQDHLLSLDLGFTPVDYNGNHPFERRRKLEDSDADMIEIEYLDGDSYESLRIKFITDPIQDSATIEDLQEVSLQYTNKVYALS
jgi:hypothetical protein